MAKDVDTGSSEKLCHHCYHTQGVNQVKSQSFAIYQTVILGAEPKLPSL